MWTQTYRGIHLSWKWLTDFVRADSAKIVKRLENETPLMNKKTSEQLL